VVGNWYTGGKHCWRNFENRKIGNVFACSSTTISLDNKRRLLSDSTYSKGAEISVHGISDNSGDVWTGGEEVEAEFWKSENWGRFYLWSHNQLCYGKTEATIGFRMLERCRDNLPWGSDFRWWWSLGRVK